MNAENDAKECRDLLQKITNTENRVERKRAILRLKERLDGCPDVKELEEEALPTLYR